MTEHMSTQCGSSSKLYHLHNTFQIHLTSLATKDLKMWHLALSLIIPWWCNANRQVQRCSEMNRNQLFPQMFSSSNVLRLKEDRHLCCPPSKLASWWTAAALPSRNQREWKLDKVSPTFYLQASKKKKKQPKPNNNKGWDQNGILAFDLCLSPPNLIPQINLIC